MKNKDRKFLGASIGFGFLSAACCILPLLAALFGISFLSVLAVKIERFRWMFIVLAILFLGVGCFCLYREKKEMRLLEQEKITHIFDCIGDGFSFGAFPLYSGFFLIWIILKKNSSVEIASIEN